MGAPSILYQVASLTAATLPPLSLPTLSLKMALTLFLPFAHEEFMRNMAAHNHPPVLCHLFAPYHFTTTLQNIIKL